MKILRITAQGLPLFIVPGVWHPVHAKTGGDLCDRAGCVAYNKSTRYRRQNSPVSEREFLKIGKGHVEAK